MRLPDQAQVFLVPVLCLALVGGAWWLLRGDAEPEAEAVPMLRALCDETFRHEFTELAEAFERRGRGGLDVRYLAAGELPAAILSEPWDVLVVAPEHAADPSIQGAALPSDADADAGLPEEADGPEGSRAPQSPHVLIGRDAADPGLAAAFARFFNGPMGQGIFLQYQR